jgi:citrate lyase subunit beta-like protein
MQLQLPGVSALVVPKVHAAEDLQAVSDAIPRRGARFNIIASIESAKSLWNLGEIASWSLKGSDEAANVSALLV